MKTGLVLEGGALRALYSAGVCDALLARNLHADYVIGVSAGIASGVSYVTKQPGRNLEIIKQYLNDPRYMGMGNLVNRKNRSFVGLDFSYREIPETLIPFDYDAFAAYTGEVEAVVTNLNTGCAEYFPVPRDDHNNLLLQASCALPLMFPIYTIGDQPYLDGGISDAIPWKHALAQGCDRVIVVLTRTRTATRGEEKLMPLIRKKYKEYPNFLETMDKKADIYNKNREELFQLEREGKVLVIAPESTMGISRLERRPEMLHLLWGQGYQMAVDRMDELDAFWTVE